MHELIPLQPQTINGNAVETVSARELHSFLESKQDFSTWIKNRIERYDFVENQDFITAPQKMERKNQWLMIIGKVVLSTLYLSVWQKNLHLATTSWYNTYTRFTTVVEHR